ncbi:MULTISPECIES: hypothetical protein [unclassified Rhizobacter]|uniref:hypothetical protein n=1 Tax=unclassified Rhizobacter TaxID=2640088 RepID=UPI0006F8B846|nr:MULTISPECIES: hypothetical protein [unclassified Rhizobacter]KQU71161.1 hypothetical protein ASC88_05190 [Rhizobacter sp. Root29]KQV97154.1 hypothetical protein ASC98_13590 [Rhizobacter sp. Root1238]KRB24226.1 hypothetical protein ASE08_19490 [Rhizobacter sp. Root16D2]
MSRTAFVYQIHYDEASRRRVEPEFIPLDNTASERPDWLEFWPILKFLQSNTLQEGAWYGFLSPRFAEKTGVNGQQVIELLNVVGDAEDVMLLSPFWDHGAFFLNAFEQGDATCAGLLDASQRFVDSIGLGIDLRTRVVRSRHTVFSNYFIAKPVFWRKWLELAQQLWKCCEDDANQLAADLNAATTYPARGGRPVALKIFLQERLACLLLDRPEFRVGSIDLSEGHRVDRMFCSDESKRADLHRCDSLKVQYLETQDETVLESYWALRRTIPTIVPVSREPFQADRGRRVEQRRRGAQFPAFGAGVHSTDWSNWSPGVEQPRTAIILRA